jgi:ATP-dependent protease ClpP protease subunit
MVTFELNKEIGAIGGISAEDVRNFLIENKDESDILFNINCVGGGVREALNMYDIIRESGKNIFANNAGKCHSAAVLIMLAAPIENRSSEPNARALVHRVRTGNISGATEDELVQSLDSIRTEEQEVLNVYAERTSKPLEELDALMKSERMCTAQDLLNYGFISKINNYNTNSLNNLKMKDLLNKLEKVVAKVTNLLPAEPVNKDFTDVDGNVLFTSEAETLEVGSDVSVEGGVYTLADGSIITVEGMKVTAIETPAPQNSEVDDLKAENEALKAELEALKANVNTQSETIEAQNAALVEVKNTLIETKAMIASKAVVAEPVNKAPEVPENKASAILDEVRNFKKK